MSAEAKAPISLPTGGGAIKGIGETFQPNLFSGTGNFSVPIFTSPGRDGFTPQLTLQYSTGNGNGPFGLGWQLSIPRIMRKTEKGLPTYTDEDVFVMSGSEDLVPTLRRTPGSSGRWEPIVNEIGGYTSYRPRTEGQFALIEHWTNPDGDTHWRATTKDNVTSVYGRTARARISDPENPQHVFEWLLEETFDAKGNHITYEYMQEDAGLNLPGIHEHNRTYTQTYIRRILYGNTPDSLDADRRAGLTRMATDHVNPLETRERHYLFEVLFDYGDLPASPSIPHETSLAGEVQIPEDWPVRADPFSTFRSGFEVRTLRRCERVLMLHHFNEGDLAGAPLVKSTDFEYVANSDTRLSFLNSVKLSGCRKDPDNPEGYLKREMPPVTFQYSAFEPEKQRYQSVITDGGDSPPRALNSPEFALMDVFGNGLPDVMQSTVSGFYYWENLGQGRLSGRHPQHGDQPAVSLSQANVSVGDMGGDGLADLVVDEPPMSGFYESAPDGHWKVFKRFEAMPSFGLSDPNTRLVDLTGDGLSDVLVTRDEHFLWYRCQGEAGYDDPRTVRREHDLDTFPDVYFDDPAGRVRLADMSGDGLSDLVLIHDGRIDYWPNLGYGRFGRRITMADAPRIGYGFDPRRMFLVDLDGTGCADLVYVDSGQVRFWFNQSGNAWSDPHTIIGTPEVTDVTAVQFTDFYGTGTASLLWSNDHGLHPGRGNYKVLDFCGGRKPNMLVELDNNMGATTRVQYAPSTKFYLEDKANGMPWNSSLPFPVQVVEKTEVIDHISRTKLTTTYKYHHGYFDGREREFRGFGRVDQFDTESFDDFTGASLHGDDSAFDNSQLGFHVPPIETRTWFHTGIYFDPDRYVDHRELTQQYRSEYYQEDSDAFRFDDHSFEQANGSGGTGETPHEAYRALRGAVLRTEIYGRDESDKADHPYAVTENRYSVKALQPKNDNNHAVYLTTSKESTSYQYERNPADPRIGHSITLDIDEYGNVTDSVSIAYPRRNIPDDLPEQGETRIVYTHADFINKQSSTTSAEPGFYYYAGVPCQTRSYDVTGIEWQPRQPHFGEHLFREIQDTSPESDATSFQPFRWIRDERDRSVERRILKWTRNYFRVDADATRIDPVGNLDHRLPLGDIESLALPYESYQAAFTNSMLDVYGGRAEDIDLVEVGGYHPHPAHGAAEGGGELQEYWWIPSGRQSFDPGKYFQPDRSQDPFGNFSTTQSDPYALLLQTARDAIGNQISATNDYRVLQPNEVTDPNGNRSQVAFDALGLVVGTAIVGEDRDGNSIGDSLDGFVADLTEDIRDQHVDDPLNGNPTTDTDPHSVLKGATSRVIYDLNRFFETGQPNVVYALARETHVSDEDGTPSRIQHAFTYSDGFGREIQKKIQAEPGPVPVRDFAGRVIVDADGQPQMTPDDARQRWVGSGWTVFNNKGKPVRQYEPFFTDTHEFEFDARIGVSPVLFYDPVERVVATLHPNQTYEKVVFDPWQQITWDVNDTIMTNPADDSDVGYFFRRIGDGEYLPTWYELRTNPAHESVANRRWPDPKQREAERRSAENTAVHAATPTTAHADSLGRAFLTVAYNRFNHSASPPTEEFYRTRTTLDIEGNQREVIDANNRLVIRYEYDMLGNRTHQASMEAGERWMLNDIAGNPFYSWDSRNHRFRTTYDALRRPSDSFLREDAATEIVIGRNVYGESRPNPETANLRGQLAEICDQAGKIITDDYDFKGNLLSSQRRLAQSYNGTLDWSRTVTLEPETYISRMRYDALNRPIQLIAPHSDQRDTKVNVTQPLYNEANLLEQVHAWLNIDAEPLELLEPATANLHAVTDIDYDARGQRSRIDYGTQDGRVISTSYAYDRETYRLTHLYTRRGVDPVTRQGVSFTGDCDNPDPPPQTIAAPDNPPSGKACGLQNLYYTYDPVGNITHIRDDAQQTIYFRNRVVEPTAEYKYDAMYRLIEATGREHLGQTAGIPNPPTAHSYNDAPRVGLLHRDDATLMGRYCECYEYDAVGNIMEMIHRVACPGAESWRRSYTYNETSQLNSGDESNRLTSTTAAGNTEDYSTDGDGYDAHGNMLRMPHLQIMQWNFQDQLQMTQRQKVNDDDLDGIEHHGETSWYVYDANGERARKVTVSSGGQVKDERIYLGGIEIHRQRTGVHAGLVRETLHIMDDEDRIAMVEVRNDVDDGSPKQLIRYQFANHIRSACLELDDEAKIISYEEYTPYGSTAFQLVHGGTETPKRYRYTGQERDEENGFYYHGLRYYAPWVGRWTTADPIGLAGGINLFEYCGSNPANRTDSTGTQPERAERTSGGERPPMTQDAPPLAGENTPVTGQGLEDQEVHGGLNQSPVERSRAGPFGGDDPRGEFYAQLPYYESADCYHREGPTYCEGMADAARSKFELFRIAMGANPSHAMLGALGMGGASGVRAPASRAVRHGQFGDINGQTARLNRLPGQTTRAATASAGRAPTRSPARTSQEQQRPTFLNRERPATGSSGRNVTHNNRGRFSLEDGKPVPAGNYEFVVINGQIRIGQSGHWALSGGAPLEFAGRMTFGRVGRLTRWDNHSGHYRPSQIFRENAGLGEYYEKLFRAVPISEQVGTPQLPVFRTPH